MEYYFETDDKLNRSRYAEFLSSMLENCDNHRRDDCDGSYVMAIDSAWGTGKTLFVKMLKNYLEGREPKIIKNKVDKSILPAPNKNRLFNVIYYNSWETDYWGDALEPLIHSVLNSELFELIRADKNCDEVTNRLWNATKGVLKAVGLGFARNIMGDAAVEVIKATIDEISKDDPDPLKAYSEGMKVYKSFKESLEQTIQTTGKKLVIIVDELDRCRPTFAIQTLELAKHLFDVKGLIFIFSLDIRQLSCSVKTVYGQDMDSSGYLCRFFDYVSKLPLPDTEVFIRSIYETRINIEKLSINVEFVEFIVSIVDSFSLSLRDIITVLQTFFLIESVFLNEYDNLIAKRLYFVLLVIKYIDPSEYSNYLCGNSKNKYLSYIERIDIPIKQKNILQQQLTEIQKHNKIGSSYMKMVALDGSYQDSPDLCITNIKTGEYDKKPCLVAQHIFSPKTEIAQMPLNPKDSWGYLLFFNDLENWSRISKQTFAEFFFRQLEMFDFVYPAEKLN